MAKKSLNFSEMGKRASETGHQLAAQDRDQEQAVAAQRIEMPLDQIFNRPDGDTRAVDPLHVLDLAESFVAVGLLEPLVLDAKNHLVAGAHRWAAVRLLASNDRKAEFEALLTGPIPGKRSLIDERLQALPPDTKPWQTIPVHRLNIDARENPQAALAAEVAENERRRDYTKIEVKQLAERLKSHGFRHVVGRPKAGEKSLTPALEAIVGKSRATIWRMLGDSPEIVSNETISTPTALAIRKIEGAIRLLDTDEGHSDIVNTLKELVNRLR